MVGRLLVGFVWLNLQFSVSWLVDFQWASCHSIFSFLCHGRNTFSGVRVAQSLVFCVMVGRLFLVFCVMVGRFLVRFVWLNLQISVHGWQTFRGVCAALSLVFCVMVGSFWGSCGSIFRFLCHGWSWLVDFQGGLCGLCHGWQSGVRVCGSIFSFLCHGWQTFSGVRVAHSLVFCVMVGRTFSGVRVAQSLVFCVKVGDFQWGSCGSIFTFLSHGWQTFSGVRVAQYLDFCVMVGGLLVGFVWLNLLFSVSWLVDFQWGSCGSIFSFLCHGWQTFSGVRVSQSLVFCVMVGLYFQGGSCGSIFSFLCHGWQTFSGVRVAQSLVFCVMVGRLLVGFVWLNLQFSVSWLVDFQWGSCGSQSLVFCVMVGRLLVGFVWLNLQISVSWLVDFSGVRVAQSLVFCVMVGRLLVGFVWLNLQFSVSWLVDFQWGSCGSIFSFLCHGWQTFSGVRVAQSLVFCVMVGRLLVGFVWLILQFSVSWQVDFQWVRVAQSLDFCVMVGRLLVGFVWLNLQFSVSWLVDFQWGSCVSIFSFLCHGWQTFSGVRVAQSLVFCVMVGRLLVGFVWLILQFSVSWQVEFQWCSCGSIFRFLLLVMGFVRPNFFWVKVGVRVAQSLVFCVMVGRLLVGFVLNLQLPRLATLVFCLMVGHIQVGIMTFSGVSCGSVFSFLRHGRQTFSGVRVAQSLVFCVMVGRLLVGLVWLKLQFSVSWQVDFQWGSCGSIFSFLRHGWQTFSGVREAQSLVFWVKVGDFQWGSCGSIFTFLSHGWQTFSGVRVAQYLDFCVMVDGLLVGFVWLNLLFSVSWLVDFQWGLCGSIFSFLCHGRQTFSGLRVTQSLVFCVMVGILLVEFVWLNLQFSVSWLVDFQWGSCGSIFSFLCYGRQIFSEVRVAQSLDFCVMVGRLLGGFVRLYLQFSVSWLVDFQWGSCVSIFSFLCHGRYNFSGVRVAQSLVFCVMVGRLLVGFVWLILQFSVSWQVDFQWCSCGSIFRFLWHGWQTFIGVRVAQSLDFCVMLGRLLLGFVLLNLQFSVALLVDFQWGSCGSIFSFLRHGWQTFSGVRVAQTLAFCVMVRILLVGFVCLNLQFSASWLGEFQWGSCGSNFSFVCHGRQTFRGVRVAQSLVFCVMVGRLYWGS